jgi:hypothetical protein
MAKTKRRTGKAKAIVDSRPPVKPPPPPPKLRRNLPLLIATAVVFVVWVGFLVYVALVA